MSSFRVAPIALLIAAISVGCAGPRAATTNSNQPSASASNQDTAALEALYRQRQQEAKMRFVPADVEFMTGMISHHAQALVMSRLAPENGAGDRVSVLAARIINSQKDEIGTMQRWLKERGQMVPEVNEDGTMPMMMHGDGGHDMHMTMPGMLTPEQMAELKAAKGADFDRLYLQLMIQHHSGALTMVDDLFAAGGAGRDEATYKMASDIHADQVTEIARMRGMLESMLDSSRDR